MKISIILPTYNESKNIEIIIPKIEELFKKTNYYFEIIIVDDNSPDGTADLAHELNNNYNNIKVIVRQKLDGIGSALRDGYDSVTDSDIILSSDSDLSFSVEDMIKLIDKINEGYDLVVGSRHTSKQNYETPNINTKIKGFISHYGNIMVRFISGVPIHDFSANFRAIRTNVWRSIKTEEKTNSILMEMILKTYYNGYKVTEIPVIFKDRIYGESKLKLRKEALKFLRKLIKYAFMCRVLRK